MFTQSLIKGTIIDKYEKEYGLYVSPNLEEKLIALVSRKYDLNEDIEITSFTFLGQASPGVIRHSILECIFIPDFSYPRASLRYGFR